MQQKWQTQDLPGHLLGPLSELKSHGFDTLLQSLFGDLKVEGAPRPGMHTELSIGGGRGGGPGGEEGQKPVPGTCAASC